MKPKRVIVSWVDSASSAGWRNLEDVNTKPMRCESTGYLVSRNKDGLVLALNHSLESNAVPYGDYISIPARAVTQVRRIKDPKRGRR